MEHPTPLVRQFVVSIAQQLCDESLLGCNQEFGPVYMLPRRIDRCLRR